MKKFYVYVHVCPNGKRYVGVTGRDPESRWGKNGEGYRHQLFERAILKYGWNNITHEVFEVESEEEMYRKEIELISFFHSNDPEYGYNCSTGGEKSASGCIRSEETRRKISEANRGRIFSEEVRRKNSEAQKKKWLDPEYRRKQTEAFKGKSVSEEQRRKVSETLKKRCLEPEVRRKKSEASKKKWTDLEFREKVSKALKGKSRSKETKKRIAEAAKNRPRIKISLPDGTVLEMTKQNLARNYINKGKKFEYVD